MLIPLVARMQGQVRRGTDRYAAWARAIELLRQDLLQHRVGDLRQISYYLNDVPVEQRQEAVLDLVAEHLRLSWRAGRGPLLEDYLSDLRAAGVTLACMASMPVELIEDEFLARHAVQHGDMPTVEQYVRRFPARNDIPQALTRRELAAGRFVKLARLGHGASAEVWEAYDRDQRLHVALKLPRTEVAEGQQLLNYFAREAQLTCELNHPGVVNLRECRHDRHEPIYWMRLATGRSLSDEIQDFHQPPAARTPTEQQLLLARLLDSLASVCDALQYAHAYGIVHCDIKPGNIIIDAIGHGAVIDWGLAQRLAPEATGGASGLPLNATRPLDADERIDGLVAGTPDYMAPEQVTGDCDERTDVFGLGATLYEILAGRAPHAWSDGLRPADWLRRVREASFARPRRWNPSAPRSLERICLKAISRGPGGRHASAAALAAEIRQYLRSRGENRSTSLLARAWRRFRDP